MTGRILRSCSECGHPRPCPRHPTRARGSWSPNRDHAAHKRFRRALMARARGRCERCGLRTFELRACHFPPLSRGGDYDPSHGLALCAPCDKETDPHAR